MEFSSLGGGKCGENSGAGVVDKFKPFAVQHTFLFGTDHLIEITQIGSLQTQSD